MGPGAEAVRASAIHDSGARWSKDVLGLLLSPSEVLVIVIITAVVVFLASRARRRK